MLWAFAFWHLPGATPEWVLRAQAACFGTNETGLPDTYGWTMLILAPLSFLCAVIVGYGRDIRQEICHWDCWNGALRLLSIFLLLVTVWEGIWVGSRVRAGFAIAETKYLAVSAGHLPDNYPRQTILAPDFTLVDQEGRPFTLSSMRGKPVILSFAYAHCQTICPAIVEQVLSAARRIPTDDIAVVFVTLDPWRDTPRTLPALAQKYQLGPGQRILSEEPKKVNEVLAAYNMAIERDEKTGEISHPGLVYVINPEGQLSYTFNNPSVLWISDAITQAQSSARTQ